jgi:uncharacterized protein YndB with AHSA1/START domain
MSKPQFVYVTYIRTTPEKLWEVFTTPEFTRKIWFGCHQDSTFERGAPWKLVYPDGRVTDTGEILEVEKPTRLVIRWRNEFRPELKAEGYSVFTYTVEPVGSDVKLTITHDIDKTDSKLMEAVSGGWPKVLSSLKSYLETGKGIENVPQCAK